MHLREKPRIISALYENGILMELTCEEETAGQLLGNIYIGRVKNIVENIQAAFVEISNQVICYLAFQDLKNPIFTSVKTGNTLKVGAFAQAVPVDQSLAVDFRSVMGVELPMVSIGETKEDIYYGLHSTNSMLDDAYRCFDEVKHLTAELAEIENGVYRLAQAIKKTQKRANALHNIMIPQFEATIKFITEALEEKEPHL